MYVYLHISIYRYIYLHKTKSNHMFLFTVKLPSLTSDYPEWHGADMLGLKSCLIHES